MSLPSVKEHTHNYKKMISFMEKSLNAFQKGIPRITKPFIDNIDFLIINFPYFDQLDMVASYFITNNTEFNSVFISKIEIFIHILYYNDTIKGSNEEFCTQNLDDASINKLHLWKGVLGRSTMDKLMNSWLTYVSDELNSNTEISKINKKDDVIRWVYRILNYHYAEISHAIQDFIDIDIVLANLDIDDTLLRRMINDKSYRCILQGAKNVCNTLLAEKKYDILETYLEFYDDDLSSSEENPIDTIDLNSLFYKFLTSKSYFDYKLLYNILVLITKQSEIQIPIYMSLLKKTSISISMKQYLYIRLICNNSDFILDDIYSKNVATILVDIFFRLKNNQYVQSAIYKFITNSLKNTQHKETIISLIKDKLDAGYKEGCAQIAKGKPRIDNVFSYCYLLLNKESRFCRLDLIKYSEESKINAYISNCIDESFVRYICKVVIDEVPVLNIFNTEN